MRHPANIALFALLIGLSSGMARSESAFIFDEAVSGFELSEGKNSYPCSVEIQTNAGKTVSLTLSDEKDVWAINIFVAGRPDIYRQFFDSRDLRDEHAFAAAFEKIRFGNVVFDLNDTTFFVALRSEVNESTTGMFSIKEQHNVAPALRAMDQDGLAITGLVKLDGTVPPLSAFATCSYEAMGLERGQSVETDTRAEYRMIFEESFENWVARMSQAERCLAGRFDDAVVNEVIEAAADAFYPGILNSLTRSSYREDLGRTLPFSKLTGMAYATADGCLLASQMVEISRMPVDQAIQLAMKLP